MVAIAGVVSILGVYCFWVAGTYLYGYVSDSDSPVRHEYLAGLLLALILAFPVWLLVSGLLYPIRKELPREIYLAWNAPAAILTLGGIGLMLHTALLVWRSYAT